MKIENEIKLDFSDVLFRPKRSTLASRKEVDLNRTFKFKHSGTEWTGVPIMAANMDGVGTAEMANALYEHRMFTCLAKNITANDKAKSIETLETLVNSVGGNYFAISIGTNPDAYVNAKKLLFGFPEIHFICIDIANGYSEHFVSFVEKVRADFPKHTIIAGNVVTADMTQELILHGADIVKVGIGPGSVCTTRIQTGVGYPQLSAIMECADAAHGLGGHIIADGGCTCPGDVAKAFGAGADFVMMGGYLSGHDQGGGEIIDKAFLTNELDTSTGKQIVDTKSFVQFYGMSSETANDKHFGGLKDYRASEGRTVLVPYKGDVNSTIQELLGGIRSTCTYIGAGNLKQLSKCTTFIRVNNQFNKVFEKSTTGK